MIVQAGNLFADISAVGTEEEVFNEIFARPGLKIERIISQGQASPPEFWYDQAWNEWVIVLKGGAILQLSLGPKKQGPFHRVPVIAKATLLRLS